MKRCKCKGTVTTELILNYTNFPLKSGCYTAFKLYRCKKCKGATSFPNANLDIALIEGTALAIDDLESREAQHRRYRTKANTS